jgi:hypothetical protein
MGIKLFDNSFDQILKVLDVGVWLVLLGLFIEMN